MRPRRPIPDEPGWEADDIGYIYKNGEVVFGSFNQERGRWYIYLDRREPNVRRVAKRSVLVCLAWHGPRPSPKHQCLHKDDDRTNDAPDNLYWGTNKDNSRDSVRNKRAWWIK
jgi:hypothetical protein